MVGGLQRGVKARRACQPLMTRERWIEVARIFVTGLATMLIVRRHDKATGHGRKLSREPMRP